MPPDHIVSQMLSILDLSAPVIMKIPLLSQSGRADVLAGYLADFLDGGMDHLGSGSGLLRA